MSRQNLPSLHGYNGPYEGKVRALEYIHGNHDEYYDWEVDENGEELFDHDLHMQLHYLNYEIPVEVEIDFDNNKVAVVAFWDGDRRFVPEE